MMIFLVSRSRLASAVGGSPDLRQLARKGAKFRCLFLEKILIHTPIQQRQIISIFRTPIDKLNLAL
jgi:hypothetical protein